MAGLMNLAARMKNEALLRQDDCYIVTVPLSCWLGRDMPISQPGDTVDASPTPSTEA